MPAAPNDFPVEYALFQANDSEGMARLLADVFTRRDPPAVAVGLEFSEFEAFVRLYGPKAARERLTVVARDSRTGEIVGALLTEDSATPAPDGMDRLSPKFDPIFDLLSELDAEHRKDRATAQPGESIHLFLLGVAESAAGRGVAQKLVATCIENGARSGYRTAVTEATGKVSQHVFRKLGFVERARGSYADHRFGGRAHFASIAEQGGPILMERGLTVPSSPTPNAE